MFIIYFINIKINFCITLNDILNIYLKIKILFHQHLFLYLKKIENLKFLIKFKNLKKILFLVYIAKIVG